MRPPPYLRRNGADVTRGAQDVPGQHGRITRPGPITISNAEIYRDCFALSVCPAEGIESPTIIGAQAANELLNIIGMKATFVFTPLQRGDLRQRPAPIDEVNVQVVMEKLGGGGHRTIAGAAVKGYDYGAGQGPLEGGPERHAGERRYFITCR